MAELREVDGFLFSSEEEYQNALKEEKAVLYLKKQLSGKDGKSILKVYNQLLEQNIFQTEVGYSFLHDINLALHRQTKIADSVIAPIRVEKKNTATPEASGEKTLEEKPPKVIVKTVSSGTTKQVKSLRIIILVLVAVIIGMFGITLTSNLPTIVDYETKLQNKYAAWEQQLTEREAQVKQKEAQLNINQD